MNENIKRRVLAVENKLAIRKFINEVNKKLAPSANVIVTKSEFTTTHSYNIQYLNKSPWIRVDPSFGTPKFVNLINKLSRKYVKKSVEFSNSNLSFWFV